MVHDMLCKDTDIRLFLDPDSEGQKVLDPQTVYIQINSAIYYAPFSMS